MSCGELQAMERQPDLAALKQGIRLAWAAGDYPAFAGTIAEPAIATAGRAGAAPA
jgi:hypothetical protein